MKSRVTTIALLFLTLPQLAFADAASNFEKNKEVIAEDYGHLDVALGLGGCQNHYVVRVKANKSLAPNWTFNSGSQDAYMNRFMQAVFDPNGKLIDPWSKPVSERYIVDGGDSTHWTAELKDGGFRVKGGTSMKVLETGPNPWMVRAEPLKVIPNFVPDDFSDVKKFQGGVPTGYSFHIQFIVFFDNSNTEKKTADDSAISDCIFYYAG